MPITKLMRSAKSHIHTIAILLLLIICPGLFADDSLLKKGITELRSRNYNESIQIFSAILSNNELTEMHADALYWLAKTRIGIKDYKNASELLNRFLTSYIQDKRIPEIRYHKARLYYLMGDPEKALTELGKFIEFTPGGELYVAALYWTGEALMTLGRLAEAKKVFSHIVTKYKDSIKYIASEYRTREIGYLEREQVLLDLLRWSYEAHMQDLESFYTQLEALQDSDSGKVDEDAINEEKERAAMEAELRARIEQAKNQLNNMRSTSQIREQLLLDKEETQKRMEAP